MGAAVISLVLSGPFITPFITWVCRSWNRIVYGVQGGGLEYEGEQSLQARLNFAREAWASRIPSLHLEPALPFAGWQDWDEMGALKIDHPRRWAM